MTFEEKLERLREIVESLESPDTLELDTSLELFEEGVRIVRSCRELLEAAEVRIQNVTQEQNVDEGTDATFDIGNGE